MVIKMIAGEGARVGINTDDPKATLHVVGEGSAGFSGDETIRCTGGLRISTWTSLGPYTDSERDALGLDPPQGLIIYNEEHDVFQGFARSPSGGRGSWSSFVTNEPSDNTPINSIRRVTQNAYDTLVNAGDVDTNTIYIIVN